MKSPVLTVAMATRSLEGSIFFSPVREWRRGSTDGATGERQWLVCCRFLNNERRIALSKTYLGDDIAGTVLQH